VQSVLDELSDEFREPYILDPFAGCGTVLVQAKLNGCRSFGIELNPLLHFIADTKVNSWTVSPKSLLRIYNFIPKDIKADVPNFLKSSSHFNEGVLHNLRLLKGGIESIAPRNNQQKQIKELLRLAFSSILIDCSNLKRAPCLGYSKTKNVDDSAPFVLMGQKVHSIAEDLKLLQTEYSGCIDIDAMVVCANSMHYQPKREFDLAITSPPYMSGMDYVINYKIEMAWLGFIKNHKEAKRIKDNMVVCDNVSKSLIRDFSASPETYTNKWIEDIKSKIARNIEKRGSYRRKDMPFIVHKYFDDLYSVMKRVAGALKRNGRFILVVGDSLIADVYVPTDLILAKIGNELGFSIENLVKARGRRSGQIRDYRLRETIITLKRN
jgi:hypothetical protein